jgi:UDPglucose 6-dehydrogenase
MLASRISFMNEIANICEKCEVDVKQVAHAIGLDKRIGSKFLNAGIGFGGSCFPKDVKALRALAKSKGVDSSMLDITLAVNDNQPQRLIDLAKSSVKDFKNKKVAVLGLAFKSNTDDMRESRAIPIINMLLEQDAVVRAYDPQAMENAKEIFGDRIEYCATADDCIEGADVCLVVTEWDEFKNIDFSKLKVKCSIIDGRRIIDPQKVKDAGLIYKGIGWKEN